MSLGLSSFAADVSRATQLKRRNNNDTKRLLIADMPAILQKKTLFAAENRSGVKTDTSVLCSVGVIKRYARNLLRRCRHFQTLC